MKRAAATPNVPDPTPAAVWRAYQGVSATALDEHDLIERHLPLVRSVVDRLKVNLPAHVDAGDLQRVGVTGLMAAIRRYDPGRGSTFSAYAILRIRGAILDELRRIDWCPRPVRARIRRLRSALDAVEQRAGRAATGDEVRAELGLSERDYAEWLEEAKPGTFIASEQAPAGGAGPGALWHDVLDAGTGARGPDAREKTELLQLLAQRIAGLPDMQRKILAMYYFENMRLAEIAAAFGLTEARICQMHTQSVLSLRAWIHRARSN